MQQERAMQSRKEPEKEERHITSEESLRSLYLAERSRRSMIQSQISVPVSIDAGRRRGKIAGHADGEQRIVAPMPGRVVRVLAQPGDEVELRQPLIVVEAMKMENELRAPKAGRVKEVAVEPGASVEAGRLLIVIE